MRPPGHTGPPSTVAAGALSLQVEPRQPKESTFDREPRRKKISNLSRWEGWKWHIPLRVRQTNAGAEVAGSAIEKGDRSFLQRPQTLRPKQRNLRNDEREAIGPRLTRRHDKKGGPISAPARKRTANWGQPYSRLNSSNLTAKSENLSIQGLSHQWVRKTKRYLKEKLYSAGETILSHQAINVPWEKNITRGDPPMFIKEEATLPQRGNQAESIGPGNVKITVPLRTRSVFRPRPERSKSSAEEWGSPNAPLPEGSKVEKRGRGPSIQVAA